MFGGENNIPANVLAAMSLKDYQKGKPLTADRILDVYAAIKDHIVTQKNARSPMARSGPSTSTACPY